MGFLILFKLELSEMMLKCVFEFFVMILLNSGLILIMFWFGIILVEMWCLIGCFEFLDI